MKREIKFRCWNHIVGRMTDSYTLEELHKQKINFMNIKFMQYTGLKDKNGVDIYEGDIVIVEYNYIGKIIVEFKNGSYNISGHNLSKCTIIGNIYQNPELLKEKK